MVTTQESCSELNDQYGRRIVVSVWSSLKKAVERIIVLKRTKSSLETWKMLKSIEESNDSTKKDFELFELPRVYLGCEQILLAGGWQT